MTPSIILAALMAAAAAAAAADTLMSPRYILDTAIISYERLSLPDYGGISYNYDADTLEVEYNDKDCKTVGLDTRHFCAIAREIHGLRARLESDTIGYWLDRSTDYNWCNTCSGPNEYGVGMCTAVACKGREVVDTVWVMRRTK